MGQRATAPSSLDIRLLGPFQMAVDGARVEDRRWPRRKPKLLVKLLALQSQHQLHRDQLMELLWPEIDPESASNNLHKIIYMARRALEPGLKSGAHSRFIITQDQLILLRAPGTLWIDVEAFEQRAAEAIRCGEPAAFEEALASVCRRSAERRPLRRMVLFPARSTAIFASGSSDPPGSALRTRRAST